MKSYNFETQCRGLPPMVGEIDARLSALGASWLVEYRTTSGQEGQEQVATYEQITALWQRLGASTCIPNQTKTLTE